MSNDGSVAAEAAASARPDWATNSHGCYGVTTALRMFPDVVTTHLRHTADPTTKS